MTKAGQTAEECREYVQETVARDLSEALNSKVNVKFYLNDLTPEFEFGGDFIDLERLVNLDEVEFDTFHSDSSQLKVNPSELEFNVETKIKSNLLRSNCRVTNQPDWGDVYIHMNGTLVPDYESIAKYIVSHRQVSHFHEEICEMIYIHLMEAYDPTELMVACLYTRRGGLDINPIRATSHDLIPGMFTSVNYRNKKTLRQ